MIRLKGILLAGGNGTRLKPLTEVTNKHLLPVYDWPMIFYPINTLKSMGVTDICVIVGGNSVGDVVNLCGDGSRFGVKLTYRHQKEAGGIAHALGLARDFAGDEDVLVILGDNIFASLQNASFSVPHVWLAESAHPEDFGCADINDGKLVGVVEKPTRSQAPSSLIVTGLYAYPNDVFNRIGELKPSERGELEVTDLTNWYVESCGVTYSLVKKYSWFDAGSVIDILLASAEMREYKSVGKSFNNCIGEQS